jgi:Secretion system C-terminal sorting domain/FG-GAP repeat
MSIKLSLHLQKKNMKKILLISLLCNVTFSQTQIGTALNGSAAEDNFGRGIAISQNGSFIAIASPGSDLNGSNTGKVNVYQKVNGNWVTYGTTILGPNQNTTIGTTVYGGSFGYNNAIALSADGQTLAVGNTNNNTTGNFSGQVKVLRYINGDWNQLGANINGEILGEQLGTSLALSSDGNTIVIGSSSYDNTFQDIGAVRVFKNLNGSWILYGQKLTGFEVQQFYGLTTSISDDGNIIAVGCPTLTVSNQNRGGVKMYKNVNGFWNDYGNTIYGSSANQNFAFALDLSSNGNTIAIGASQSNLSGVINGSVRVFSINSSNVWAQVGSTIQGDAAGDNFGSKLSLSDDGNVIAIGSRYNDFNGSDSGTVKIFSNTGNNWIFKTRINGLSQNDLYGDCALSDDGNTVIVASAFKDESFTNAGQVRVFDLSSTLGVDSTLFSKNNLKVYPNPTYNAVNLKFLNGETSFEVNVYNDLGQKVGSHKNVENIDLSDFSNGVYVLEINSAEKITFAKVVKI